MLIFKGFRDKLSLGGQDAQQEQAATDPTPQELGVGSNNGTDTETPREYGIHACQQHKSQTTFGGTDENRCGRHTARIRPFVSSTHRTMKSVVRQVCISAISGLSHEIVSASPFRLHRRIGPRPAFPGVDATVKAEGAAPLLSSPSGGPKALGFHLSRTWALFSDEPHFFCLFCFR